ncbi:hypothetical protein [Arthrobacter sp. H35-D1]|uniref:hypothetical protein n=1 Tax=Arthrobacter sp. H35-D1 TaxID=3046202 RepID=UPI0024B9D98E|nr:hypothetical protein [Arthrobacter sp. H35-D1]MDJ0313958.1 hypothetical protein [Arthrobacter sp. H35-D1]
MSGRWNTENTGPGRAVQPEPEPQPQPQSQQQHPLQPQPALEVDRLARLHRRRTLLLRSAPVVLAAVLLGVKLLSLPVSAGQAADSYGASNAGGTLGGARAMGLPNLVERWKPRFAQGDGHVLQGDFEQAREQFSQALELVPAGESCKVRVNLVLSLEKLGEAREKAGDPTSAMELFAEGSETVAQAPRDCFMANSGNNQDGEGKALREAAERLEEKQSAGPGDAAQGPDGDGETPTPPPPAGKMEQLEQTGQKAQQERGQRQKLKEQLDADDSQPYPKPW